MALKILRRQQDLRSMQAQMETLVSERDAFAAREHELEADIAAAQTEEDRAAVDAAIDESQSCRPALTQRPKKSAALRLPRRRLRRQASRQHRQQKGVITPCP